MREHAIDVVQLSACDGFLGLHNLNVVVARAGNHNQRSALTMGLPDCLCDTDGSEVVFETAVD